MPSEITKIITIIAELQDPQEHTRILRACIYFQQSKIKLYTVSKIQQKKKRGGGRIHLDHLSDFFGLIHF